MAKYTIVIRGEGIKHSQLITDKTDLRILLRVLLKIYRNAKKIIKKQLLNKE